MKSYRGGGSGIKKPLTHRSLPLKSKALLLSLGIEIAKMLKREIYSVQVMKGLLHKVSFLAMCLQVE